MEPINKEFVEDFAASLLVRRAQIVFLLYTHPKDAEEKLNLLSNEVEGQHGVRIVHLATHGTSGDVVADAWVNQMSAAGGKTTVFVARGLSDLGDPEFSDLLLALEVRREQITEALTGALLLWLTAIRMREVSEAAPNLVSVAGVACLAEDRVPIPGNDIAYQEDVAALRQELCAFESKYGFPSSELFERMMAGRCKDIPPSDLKRWETTLGLVLEEP